MTNLQDFKDGFNRLDVATSQIAEVLKSIGTKIGSMTAAEEDAARAQLEAAASSLEAMATNAANPVPVEPPTV